MLFRSPAPQEVFTPRASDVNPKTYVDRSELEERLEDSISGSKHLIIHGESGNGKSWLYKKVFLENNTPFAIVNLANAVRFDGVAGAIKDKLSKTKGDEKELDQIVINHQGGIAPEGVGYTYTHQKIYKVLETDPFEALIALVRKNGGKTPGIVVFDNFESLLTNRRLINELANILILLDDDDYSKFNVKICIVGVPSEIREYLTETASMQTIANRLTELPEVARLSSNQARELISKGFGLLGIKNLKESHVERILWASDRIAQYIHEYCLHVARIALKDNRLISEEIIKSAEKKWFEESVSAMRQTIDANMNARETKAGRRNQVLYSLGCIKTEDFRYTDVEAVVRKEFPESTAQVELNIIQRLGELEKSEHPVIKRVPKGDAYRIINPRTKIAIRVMLEKVGNKVSKRPEFT